MERKHAPPKTGPHSFGFRQGTDLDKLNQLVDELEAEHFVSSEQSQRRQREQDGPASNNMGGPALQQD
jgi:hypothetical protein